MIPAGGGLPDAVLRAEPGTGVGARERPADRLPGPERTWPQASANSMTSPLPR
jgi:hypothetical protein